jgi:hypothetical protein
MKDETDLRRFDLEVALISVKEIGFFIRPSNEADIGRRVDGLFVLSSVFSLAMEYVYRSPLTFTAVLAASVLGLILRYKNFGKRAISLALVLFIIAQALMWLLLAKDVSGLSRLNALPIAFFGLLNLAAYVALLVQWISTARKA